MFKRKFDSDQASQHVSAATKREKQAEHNNPAKYINYQRTLVLSSRGTAHRDRHLLSDIRDLLPHSKKDVKLDTKDRLSLVNEVADLKNCNNCLFFEARKHKDLYLWVSRTPNGPSAKFLVQNIHTMAEVKLTGNCLKGSRPLLVFDKSFDLKPQYALLKELFTQVFGSPKGHPRVKPFVDHVMSFFIADNRIWFRNYQIVFDPSQEQINAAPVKGAQKDDPVLVEIGPRFVLNPVKIFSGSFGGATLWENPDYISPNTLRAMVLARKGSKYDQRQESHKITALNKEAAKLEANPIDTVFDMEVKNTGKNNDEDDEEEEEEEEQEQEEDEDEDEEDNEEDEEEEDEDDEEDD